MNKNCYNCGAERDPFCFFWLIIDINGNPWAYDTIDTGDIKAGERAIEVECCPKCGAEQ